MTIMAGVYSSAWLIAVVMINAAYSCLTKLKLRRLLPDELPDAAFLKGPALPSHLAPCNRAPLCPVPDSIPTGRAARGDLSMCQAASDLDCYRVWPQLAVWCPRPKAVEN